MQSQKLCLKWNNHTTNLLTVLGSFRLKEQLVDVTISCEGQNLKAHKMILSACSPYFEDIFQQNPCQHPIIIMNGMKYDDITAILNFMYKGEVNVSQDGLTSFLQAAEALKVKGLAEVCGEKSSTNSINKEIKQSDLNRPQRTDTPPRKRHRNRKRSLSDSNRSDEEGTSRKQHNREPSSPEIHELSGDESFTGDNSSNGPPFNSSPRVPQNVYSRSHQSSSNMVGEEDEFEVEPSKMLEQTLTTEPASNSNSDNNLRIERIMGNATEIESSSLQEPESPPDIKPIIDFGEGSAGPSENAMMLYNEQSQPGPSSLQDGQLIHDNSHAQVAILLIPCDAMSTTSRKVSEKDRGITSNLPLAKIAIASNKEVQLSRACNKISTSISKICERDKVITSKLPVVKTKAPANKGIKFSHPHDEISLTNSEISELSKVITSDLPVVASKAAAKRSVSITSDWLSKYQIPYNRFPKTVLSAIEKGIRPTHSSRREMVRIIIGHIMRYTSRPVKKELDYVASMIVKRHPKSFMDTFKDICVGKGYEGLSRQLCSRVENIRRERFKSAEMKRSLSSKCYRCINFLPNVPDGEDDVSRAKKKETLKELFTSSEWNESQIGELMEIMFHSQRMDISKEMPFAEFILEWPFLSISSFLLKHFEFLMNFDIVQLLNEAFKNKIPELNSYLKSVLKDDEYGHTMYHFLENLCKYFGETTMIKIYDEDCDMKVIETDENAPDTPYIASLGDPYKLEENCILMIQHKTASEFLPISQVIAVWFSSFHVYNLQYPKTCILTAEFFQRALLGINPNKTSKFGRKSSGTHVKILALVDKLSSHMSSPETK